MPLTEERELEIANVLAVYLRTVPGVIDPTCISPRNHPTVGFNFTSSDFGIKPYELEYNIGLQLLTLRTGNLSLIRDTRLADTLPGELIDVLSTDFVRRFPNARGPYSPPRGVATYTFADGITEDQF